MGSLRSAFFFATLVPACGGAAHGEPPAAPSAAAPAAIMAGLPLPGATGPAFLDFIVFEPARSRVWVPVGSTGSVDVLDTATATFERIDGFKTEERETKGKKRTFGPSAAAVGDGVVYVGNRATSEICPIEIQTLTRDPCLKLAAATDGVAYAASVREVWVTNPKAQTLTILDASRPGALHPKALVKLEGAPEGYAIDETRGLFYTNLEDTGATLAIGLKTREVSASWTARCGPDGPRGLAFDAAHDFLLVACTDHVQVLDAAHDGALLGKLDTGAGLDNIDFADGKVFAAAGKAARLTIAKLDAKGDLAILAVASTSEGARNAVAGANGSVFVADAQGARLLRFEQAPQVATPPAGKGVGN
jgi:DNA-binding beta-propeller fold protein YncE